jgi:hypothetical protein
MKTTPRWVVIFDNPTGILPGHAVKEADSPHTPVAILPVNKGASLKGVNRQRNNAVLIAHAPELFDLVREIAESPDLSDVLGIRRRAIDLLKDIKKAPR